MGVVLNLRERIVEVMKELPPVFVGWRLAKPLRVTRERVPPHEQEITVGCLDAAPKFVALITRHGRDDSLRLDEGSLEAFALARPHVQDGDFKHHARERSCALRCALVRSSLSNGSKLSCGAYRRRTPPEARRCDAGRRPAMIGEPPGRVGRSTSLAGCLPEQPFGPCHEFRDDGGGWLNRGHVADGLAGIQRHCIDLPGGGDRWSDDGETADRNDLLAQGVPRG